MNLIRNASGHPATAFTPSVHDDVSRPHTTVAGAAAAVIAVVAYSAFWRPTPVAFDEYLALPIARAAADSSLYAANDLLILAGLRGPFHLYRAASVLYGTGSEVDVWWFSGLILSLAGLAVAVWALATSLRLPVAVRGFVTVLVCVSPVYRGTVNWSGLPLLSFISASVALPIALGSVAAALAGRPTLAALCTGLAFNVHPGAGVLAGAVSLAVLLADAGASRRASIVRWCWLATLVASPNIAFILVRSWQNFSASSEERAAFWEIFRLFAYHVYPRDHWREGYAWFAMQLAAAALALRTAPAQLRRRVWVALATACGAIALYALAIAFESAPSIVLLFLGRASWLIKPIAFAVVAAGLHRAWGDVARRPFIAGAATCMVAAVLHRNVGVSEGFLALGIAAWVASGRAAPARVTAGLIATLGLSLAWMSRGGASPPLLDIARLVAMAMSALVIFWCVRRQTDSSGHVTAVRTTRGATISTALPAALAIAAGASSMHDVAPRSLAALTEAASLSTPAAALDGLSRWAADSTPAGTMFLVPPADMAFVPFRLQAGRSIYVHVTDIPQLAYDLSVYQLGYRRLLATGVVVVGPHAFDSRAYMTMSDEQLAARGRDGVIYAVFDASVRRSPSVYPVAWQDERWIVYRVAEPDPSSGRTQ